MRGQRRAVSAKRAVTQWPGIDTRRDAEDAMDQLVSQEFSWLHVMNVSLGIATLLVMLFAIGAMARDIAHHARLHRH